jgi:hypothetical protein
MISRSLLIRWLCAAAVAVTACARSPLDQGCPHNPLRDAAVREGTVRVLATLQLEPSAGTEERQQIADAQTRLLTALGTSNVEVLRRYGTVPQLALRLDEPALCLLLTSRLVTRVDPDSPDPGTQ